MEAFGFDELKNGAQRFGDMPGATLGIVCQPGSARLRRTDGGDAIALLRREQIRIAAEQ
jgi:hypothetical protein